MGFITLLLTVAKQPVSKICIPRSLARSFLPCMHQTPFNGSEGFEEEKTCMEVSNGELGTILITRLLLCLI